jgi:hypothetical protein
MKKEGFAFILIILLVISSYLVIAQDAKVDKAYECLNDKVEGNCDGLTVEEKSFAAMAIGECVSELADDSNDEECWPGSSCRLRDTALAVLAFRRNSRDTEDAEDWLIGQAEAPDDLTWFLEIDSDEESECTVSYSEKNYDITVREDKKLTGAGGSCLSVDSSGYWLEIDDSCYDENFTISCNKDFITTLLYKKKTGSTIYVSSKTNFGSSEGKTEEKVNSLCFGVNCDYEGSLWATLALAETGHDVSPYLPYLIAMAEDNEKYFPSAFLYIITDYDDFFAEIIELQINDYWKITDSPYHQFYDTALALLSLQGLDSEQASAAKTYLLEVQDDNGCWRNNVRDTSFILYAAWPKSTGGGGGAGIDYCEDFNFYCVSPNECDQDDIRDLPCEGSLGKVCCTEEPVPETCESKGGEICEGDEECIGGRYVQASDTSRCCRGGSCIIPEPPEPECELEGYYCRSECDDEEQENAFECNSGDVCCEPKPPSPSYWWIWLLIILIILVVLAIIFRERIRVFIFKLRNKGKKGPSGAPPRRFPPSPQQQQRPMARPRMILPKKQAPPRRPVPKKPAPKKPPEKKDRELEDTLKKLKDMSK